MSPSSDLLEKDKTTLTRIKNAGYQWFNELGDYKANKKFDSIFDKENRMILCSEHKNVFEYKESTKYKSDDKTLEAKTQKKNILLYNENDKLKEILKCFEHKLKVYVEKNSRSAWISDQETSPE